MNRCMSSGRKVGYLYTLRKGKVLFNGEEEKKKKKFFIVNSPRITKSGCKMLHAKISLQGGKVYYSTPSS